MPGQPPALGTSSGFKANTRTGDVHNKFSIVTDAPPEVMKDTILWVYQEFIKFALGLRDVQGYRLKNPTGRLARAARIESDGMYKWAVVVDENVAPEARWIEEGHGSVDLKKKTRLLERASLTAA